MNCSIPQKLFCLIVVLRIASVGVAEESEVLVEPFNGKTQQKWTIIRENDSHLSFEKAAGCLTLTTERGTIHGDEKNDAFSEGTQAKNIHLLDRSVQPDQDFVFTLNVQKFKPEHFYHQVAIIAYVDDDNYVKWSFEQSRAAPAPTRTVLVCETNAQPTHKLITEIDVQGPFALRLERFGTNWICSHSLNGERFQVVGIEDYSLDTSKERPLRIGFLAKNGGNPKASEIDVAIDNVRLELKPVVPEPSAPTK